MRLAFLRALILLSVATGSVALAECPRSCTAQPNLVGACFVIRGRATLYNGNPTVRIWKAGTHRLLGVSQSRCQEPECQQMPDEFRKLLDWDHAVFGDFLVCPFTESRPGEMQLVCVESVSHIAVRERK